MTDVKEEVVDFGIQGQGPDALPEEVLGVAEDQPFDSEDSLSQEQVASELRRLNELRTSIPPAEMRTGVTSDCHQNQEEGAVAPGAEKSAVPLTNQDRQGAVAPDSEGNRENNEAYAPQRKRGSVDDCDHQTHTCSVLLSG